MSTVVRLFFRGRPTAVVAGIRTVVVNSIQRMLRHRFASHIGKKILVLVPLWINRDAAATIPLILGTVWIAATISHVFPCHIFWGPVVRMCCPFAIQFAEQASARAGPALFQIARKNFLFTSTIAATQPNGVMIAILTAEADDGPAAKALTGKNGWHNG